MMMKHVVFLESRERLFHALVDVLTFRSVLD
jgi:hypothetical protein